MKDKIQCVVHGLSVHNSKVLVYSVEDKIDQKNFFRLIGGHIEFSEAASEALIREFKEEINQKIKIVKELDIFENIFFYNGKNCHEFVTLLEIEFLNKEIYDQDNIVGNEGPNRTFNARWIPVSEFKDKNRTLFPPQVLDYL